MFKTYLHLELLVRMSQPLLIWFQPICHANIIIIVSNIIIIVWAGQHWYNTLIHPEIYQQI